MLHFFRRRIPAFDGLVLVESGARHLADRFLASVYENHPSAKVDLVTCYAGTPPEFRPDRGTVHRVADYPDAAARRSFLSHLSKGGYTTAVIICSGEPIMVKWKWVIAARLPVKVLILNENGDYFWFDYSNLGILRQLLVQRAGLSGAGAITALVRLVVFPFTLAYLLMYAATVHLRRKVRT